MKIKKCLAIIPSVVETHKGDLKIEDNFLCKQYLQPRNQLFKRKMGL